MPNTKRFCAFTYTLTFAIKLLLIFINKQCRWNPTLTTHTIYIGTC